MCRVIFDTGMQIFHITAFFEGYEFLKSVLLLTLWKLKILPFNQKDLETT